MSLPRKELRLARRTLVENFAVALGRLLATYERQGIGGVVQYLSLDFAVDGPVSQMTFELIDAELCDIFSNKVNDTLRELRDGRPLRAIDA